MARPCLYDLERIFVIDVSLGDNRIVVKTVIPAPTKLYRPMVPVVAALS